MAALSNNAATLFSKGAHDMISLRRTLRPVTVPVVTPGEVIIQIYRQRPGTAAADMHPAGQNAVHLPPAATPATTAEARRHRPDRCCARPKS
ncbi:hypothetical protein [Halovulum marinum]|uniref:hypothetical protein n=1 Tax=Halovulum marinum TaxID=2662447 RepID=UPI0012B24108|nr:hypothetical protein [Halovulum marinum]